MSTLIVRPQFVGDPWHDASAYASVQSALDAAALDAFGGVVRAAPGSTEVPDTLRVPSGVELHVPRGARLLRPTSSPLTDPVVRLVGPDAKLTGKGRVESEKASPQGVVLVGPAYLCKLAHVSIAASDATLTSTAYDTFTTDDVGKSIAVNGAGAAGVRLLTTIASFTSSTVVELAVAASTTTSGERAWWGDLSAEPPHRCEVSVAKVKGLPAPGNRGVVWNSSPPGFNVATFYGRMTDVDVGDFEIGVECRPNSNAHHFAGIGMSGITSIAYRFFAGQQVVVLGGFITESPSITVLKFERCFNNRALGVMAEPGGTARMVDIDANSTRVAVVAPDANCAAANIDNGTESVVWTNANQGVARFGAYAEMTENVAPAAPAANTVRLFARDNGAGKTQFCALFPTGAVQPIVTEP